MSKVIKVYLNKNDKKGKWTGEREIVEATLVQKNARSVLVMLPNGHIIIRKTRDIVEIL